jgi:hypothetical protein
VLHAFTGAAKKMRKPRSGPRATGRAHARAWHCGACVTRICDESDAVAAGPRTHRFTNPAGYTFDIACFSDAPGCRAAGEPSLEHTWFPGHAWTVAVCRNCGVHLGWHFSDGESPFWGLILERLVGPI